MTQFPVNPDIIDLGRGHPSPALLPLNLMRQAAELCLAETAKPTILQYGATPGSYRLRESLAQFLTDGYAINVQPEALFMTGGASQGLDFICTHFTQPGDTVFVEEPTYFLALGILKDYNLNVVGLPLDDQGLIIEALEAQLKTERPVFLYTIPTFQNPTGVTLSAERRQRLADLSARYNFWVVADEVYQLLNYTTTPPPPMPHYNQGGKIISMGSFSKILGPGLRLGWLQAGTAVINRFSKSGMLNSGGGLNYFTGVLVGEVIRQGWQATHLTTLKQVYTHRSQVLHDAICQHLPLQKPPQPPAGGYFIWATLPDKYNTSTLLATAEAAGVSFKPGDRFSSTGNLQNTLRLGFSYYEEDNLQEGIQRLAECLEAN